MNTKKEFFDRFDKLRHFSPSTKGATVERPAVITGPGILTAQFDITITRNSSNINTDLDVAILGFTEIISGYQDFINPSVGGTVAVTGGIYNSLPDRYRFTHTVGANTDTIDVSCPQHAYPALVNSSGFDLYQIDNIRYTVMDSTLADAQFNNKFNVAKQTIFGLKKDNPLPVIANKNPMNNLDNIIDIPVNMVMDKETCLVLSMAPNAAGAGVNEITLSMFVSFFNKYDSSKIYG